MGDCLNIDEAEKKAVDYLQTKFGPKSIKAIKVSSASFAVLHQVVVKGELESKDGLMNNFEVIVSTDSATIISWKVTPQ